MFGSAITDAQERREVYIKKIGQQVFDRNKNRAAVQQGSLAEEAANMYHAHKRLHDNHLYRQFSQGSYDQLAYSRSIVHDVVNTQSHSIRYGN